MIKWISPYWYNKALPTPTLTLHDTLFLSLIIYLIFYENK